MICSWTLFGWLNKQQMYMQIRVDLIGNNTCFIARLLCLINNCWQLSFMLSAVRLNYRAFLSMFFTVKEYCRLSVRDCLPIHFASLGAYDFCWTSNEDTYSVVLIIFIFSFCHHFVLPFMHHLRLQLLLKQQYMT